MKFLKKLISSPLGQIATAFLPGIGPIAAPVVRTVVGGLGSMWANQAAAKDAAQQQQIALQQQKQAQDQLSNLFGPSSSYAQQLREQLERKDAAAGRRSQYGTREVELQARLAGLAAQYAPGMNNSMMEMSRQAMQAGQARRQAQSQNLSILDKAASDLGVYEGLQNIFNRPSGGGTMSNQDAYSLMGEGGYNMNGSMSNQDVYNGMGEGSYDFLNNQNYNYGYGNY